MMDDHYIRLLNWFIKKKKLDKPEKYPTLDDFLSDVDLIKDLRNVRNVKAAAEEIYKDAIKKIKPKKPRRVPPLPKPVQPGIVPRKPTTAARTYLDYYAPKVSKKLKAAKTQLDLRDVRKAALKLKLKSVRQHALAQVEFAESKLDAEMRFEHLAKLQIADRVKKLFVRPKLRKTAVQTLAKEFPWRKPATLDRDLSTFVRLGIIKKVGDKYVRVK